MNFFGIFIIIPLIFIGRLPSLTDINKKGERKWKTATKFGLQLLFDIFDVNSDGNLNKRELNNFLNSNYCNYTI